MRILLAEDDRTLATGIARALTAADWIVDHVNSGDVAEIAAQSVDYDALVLDLNLPHRSGFDVLEHLRSAGKDIPVIIITARDSLEDRIHGLGIGADDYLTKPFDIAELNARLHAIVRRRGRVASAGGPAGEIELDARSRAIVVNGARIDLSANEFDLMAIFVANIGNVVSKEEIARELSQSDGAISANAVEVSVHRLRKRLEETTYSLRTVRGLGYLLEKNRHQ